MSDAVAEVVTFSGAGDLNFSIQAVMFEQSTAPFTQRYQASLVFGSMRLPSQQVAVVDGRFVYLDELQVSAQTTDQLHFRVVQLIFEAVKSLSQNPIHPHTKLNDWGKVRLLTGKK